MRKIIFIFVLFLYLPFIANATEITVGTNFGVGNFETITSSQNYYLPNTPSQQFDEIDNSIEGPALFYSLLFGVRFDNNWELDSKIKFNLGEGRRERSDDKTNPSTEYFETESEFNNLKLDLSVRYYFFKFLYLIGGLEFNYLDESRKMDEFNSDLGANPRFLDYNLEVLQFGPMAGIGFYVTIKKGFYFKFEGVTHFLYGNHQMAINSYKDSTGFDVFIAELDKLKEKERTLMAFGENLYVAFGYYFRSIGIDVNLGFDYRYMTYMQDDSDHFNNYDGKDEHLFILSLSFTYTFSLGERIRPWQDSKGDKIWIPTHDGKSTWL